MKTEKGRERIKKLHTQCTQVRLHTNCLNNNKNRMFELARINCFCLTVICDELKIFYCQPIAATSLELASHSHMSRQSQ